MSENSNVNTGPHQPGALRGCFGLAVISVLSMVLAAAFVFVAKWLFGI